MSDVDPVSSASSSTATEGATSTSTSPTGTAGEFNASTQIGSMSDLKDKAPELYKAMMQGLATNICNDMKDHQERLKEMQRQATRDAQG